MTGNPCQNDALPASLLRKLHDDVRDRVLREAAEAAAHDYDTDRDLTGFEAFGKADLYEDYE